MIFGLILVALGAWMLRAGVTGYRRGRAERAAALEAQVASARSSQGLALSPSAGPVSASGLEVAEERLRDLLREPVVARGAGVRLTPESVYVDRGSYPLEEATTARVERGGTAKSPLIFLHLDSRTWAKVVRASVVHEQSVRDLAAQVPVMSAQVGARRAALARAREDVGAASTGLPASLAGPEHELYRPPTGPDLPVAGRGLVLWGALLLLWGLMVLL